MLLKIIGAVLALAVSLAAGSQKGTVPSGEPFLSLCGAARAGEVREIRFDEMYSGVSSRGIVLSDALKSCEGRRVRMVGFMAPPLTPTISFFVLTREPMSICPFCSSDADWPSDIVVVKPLKTVKALPFDSPISVTGILELGTEVDEETGFVSLIRIRAEDLEAL